MRITTSLILAILTILLISCENEVKQKETISSNQKENSFDTINTLPQKTDSTSEMNVFLDAIVQNDFAKIKQMMAEGYDINQKIIINRYRESTPFKDAIYYCDTTTLRFMLENGAISDIQLKENMSPIHYAAGEDLDKLKLLLEYKPNLNIYTYYSTPLLYAIENGRIENVKLLIDNGAHIDPDSTNNFKSALCQAINYEKFEIIDLLMERNVDLNAKSINIIESSDCFLCLTKRTPLSSIVSMIQYDNKERFKNVLLRMIKKGIEVNQIIDNGITALDLASHYDIPEAITILINNGAKIDEAINYAAQFSSYKSVKVLLENGANPNFQNERKRTPLLTGMFCCGDGFGDGITYQMRIKTIELLLDAGADINFIGANGKSFLDAVKLGYHNIYSYFIEKGILSWSDLNEKVFENIEISKVVNTDSLLVKLQPTHQSSTLSFLIEGDTVLCGQSNIVYEFTPNSTEHWTKIKIRDKVGFVPSKNLSEIESQKLK